MSKAKLEFDLTDFDDRIEFERVNRSTDMAIVLWDMIYNTRKQLEHKFEDAISKGETPDVFDGIESVLDLLNERLTEKGIMIDKLIV